MRFLKYAVYLFAKFQRKSRLAACRHCVIHPTSKVEGGSQVVSLTMDRHSFCGYDCMIVNVDIGAFCSIADRVCIGGAGHPIGYVSTSPVFLSHKDSVQAKFARHQYQDCPKTIIGHDVWIGYGAFIKSGVRIGNGAVVGMGAVVTRDVEPYTVVGGNPARKISERFPKDIADALTASEWWLMSDAELKESSALFTDVELFLKSRNLL